MPTFAYTALKGDGKRVTGELDAGDRGAAMDLLDRGGLQPMKLDLKSESGKSESEVAKSKAKNDEPLSTGPIKLKKNDIVLLLTAQASKEAAEHATAQINVASTKVIKDNAINDLALAESSADAREIAKEAAQKKLDDISGKTAFNNALNSGHSLALATQEIEKTIREAATNAGLPIAIINAGIAAQGSAFNQALEEGLSLQDAFNAAMDAGAKITEFENYKLTAKNDLNVKTAALNTALSEVDAKEAILDKAQKDLNLAKEISVNEGKESIQASLAKDNANNEFYSAKENFELTSEHNKIYGLPTAFDNIGKVFFNLSLIHI